jgi:hypothetical protein
MAKQTYRVKSPVHHGTTADDQRRYEIDEDIEIEDAHAKRLLASGAIAEIPKPRAAAKAETAAEKK